MLAGKIACGLLALALAAAPLAPARADDEGVPPNVQFAIDSGLEWLAQHQGRDGSWNGDGPTSAAATGLGVMAFMARGHVPGQGKYGDVLNKGVDAILHKQDAKGVFGIGSALMYEHGICTVALCEAYGMLDDDRQAKCRVAISKAVRVILDAQRIAKDPNDQGGWRYQPDDHTSDISVSGWQMMALRGASNAGADIPKKALDDGIEYIKRRAVFGGGFDYTSGGEANAARTGTGILALTLMNQADAPEVKAGADYLLRTPIGADHYFYTVYYCSQAAWQLGDKYWTIIDGRIADDLVRRKHADGSWSDTEGSDFYCTAMAILALSVPYRYLPIYQR